MNGQKIVFQDATYVYVLFIDEEVPENQVARLVGRDPLEPDAANEIVPILFGIARDVSENALDDLSLRQSFEVPACGRDTQPFYSSEEGTLLITVEGDRNVVAGFLRTTCCSQSKQIVGEALGYLSLLKVDGGEDIGLVGYIASDKNRHGHYKVLTFELIQARYPMLAV